MRIKKKVGVRFRESCHCIQISVARRAANMGRGTHGFLASEQGIFVLSTLAYRTYLGIASDDSDESSSSKNLNKTFVWTGYDGSAKRTLVVRLKYCKWI